MKIQHHIVKFRQPRPWWLSLPAIWETQVWSLAQEDSLEKEMATHSSTGKFHEWRSLVGSATSMGSQRVGHDWSDLAAAAAAVLTEVVGRTGSPSSLSWERHDCWSPTMPVLPSFWEVGGLNFLTLLELSVVFALLCPVWRQPVCPF